MSDPAQQPTDAPTDAPADAPTDAPTDAPADDLPVAAPPAGEAQAPAAAFAPTAEPGTVPAAEPGTEAGAEPAIEADAGPGAGSEAPASSTAADAPGLSPAACGQRLAERFPALFGGAPLPIKLRIHVDLQARAPGEFPRRALGPFFARYTTSNAYLKVLSTATQRFDLDGQPAGEVTEEHRSAALAELARRREIVLARRAAERERARPPRAAAAAAEPAATPSADVRPRPGGPPRARHERPPQTDEQRRATRPPQIDEQRRAPRPPRSGGADPAAAARPDRPRDRRSEQGHERHPGRHPGRDAGRRPGGPSPRHDSRRAGPASPQAAQPQAARHDEAAPRFEALDPAQRERALLLRQYESSPLTKSNFCVLRRIGEAELDAQLELARSERDSRGPHGRH